jgi:hypothetical protein
MGQIVAHALYDFQLSPRHGLSKMTAEFLVPINQLAAQSDNEEDWGRRWVPEGFIFNPDVVCTCLGHWFTSVFLAPLRNINPWHSKIPSFGGRINEDFVRILRSKGEMEDAKLSSGYGRSI